MGNINYKYDSGFADIKPFESKVWLSSPTMYGDKQKYGDKSITQSGYLHLVRILTSRERITSEKLVTNMQLLYLREQLHCI